MRSWCRTISIHPIYLQAIISRSRWWINRTTKKKWHCPHLTMISILTLSIKCNKTVPITFNSKCWWSKKLKTQREVQEEVHPQLIPLRILIPNSRILLYNREITSLPFWRHQIINPLQLKTQVSLEVSNLTRSFLLITVLWWALSCSQCF